MIFRVIYGNPIRYYLDGAEVSEVEYRRASKRREKTLKAAGVSLDDALHDGGFQGQSQTPVCWPQKSLALSCHPRQVKAITERNKRHGISGVEYLPDGTCVVADRGARKALMALEGLHDNEGGYGDDHAANTSPLHREDEVPFDNEMLAPMGYCDEHGGLHRLE